MSDPWAQARRVPLAEPWDAFWIEVFADPPLAVYVEFEERLAEMERERTTASAEAVIAVIAQLVKAHNLTDRDGRPIELSLRGGLTAGQLSGISKAIRTVLNGGGSADPLPSKAPSRGRSSRKKASRSTSGSSS